MHALKENCRVLLDEILKYLITSQAFKIYFATFMDFFLYNYSMAWHFKLFFCMRKSSTKQAISQRSSEDTSYTMNR